MGILLAVGVLLYVTQQSVRAYTASQDQSVTISGVVLGPPPHIGARFLTLAHTTTTQIFPVSGTCAPTTLVVVDTSGQTAGSASCSTDGTFTVPVQLQSGTNVLQARNYDALNQAGPDTPVVVIDYIAPVSQSVTPPRQATQVPPKTTYSALNTPPFMPACYDYKGGALLTSTKSLSVLTTCIVRGAQPKQQSQLGIMTYGGTLPYTILVDWGDQTRSSTVVTDGSYQLIPFTYSSPGIYTVQIHLTDKTGATSFMQTIIEVDGQPANVASTLGDTTAPNAWFNQVPIPVYIFTISLTVCLWGIALAERHFKPHLFTKKHRTM